MSRSYILFIEDILEAIKKIEKYIDGLDLSSFISNDMIIDAVLRNLEVIGEASRKIPEDIKEQNPHIPWKRMISLRNITVHEYFGIDPNIIWVIITQNLTALKVDLETLFQKLQNKED